MLIWSRATFLSFFFFSLNWFIDHECGRPTRESMDSAIHCYAMDETTTLSQPASARSQKLKYIKIIISAFDAKWFGIYGQNKLISINEFTVGIFWLWEHRALRRKFAWPCSRHLNFSMVNWPISDYGKCKTNTGSDVIKSCQTACTFCTFFAIANCLDWWMNKDRIIIRIRCIFMDTILLRNYYYDSKGQHFYSTAPTKIYFTHEIDRATFPFHDSC